MYLCITGFLPDDNDDDSLKFELDIDPVYHEQVMRLLGYSTLNEMAEGLSELSSSQITAIANLTGESLPADLQLLIGLYS